VVWLIIIAAVLLGVGELFVIAASGTFRRGLDWVDYLALLGPFVAAVMLVVFFMFLPWPAALILTFVVVGFAILGVSRLLKVSVKKRAQ
jgi:hypothetical protein